MQFLSDTNADLISFPSIFLIGMFCKFGLALASLPVLVAANKKEVCTRLLLELIYVGRVSVYVFLSLDFCLQFKTNLGNSCPWDARSSNTATLVAKFPFLVFLLPAIFNFS